MHEVADHLARRVQGADCRRQRRLGVGDGVDHAATRIEAVEPALVAVEARIRDRDDLPAADDVLSPHRRVADRVRAGLLAGRTGL